MITESTTYCICFCCCFIWDSSTKKVNKRKVIILLFIVTEVSVKRLKIRKGYHMIMREVSTTKAKIMRAIIWSFVRLVQTKLSLFSKAYFMQKNLNFLKQRIEESRKDKKKTKLIYVTEVSFFQKNILSMHFCRIWRPIQDVGHIWHTLY